MLSRYCDINILNVLHSTLLSSGMIVLRVRSRFILTELLMTLSVHEVPIDFWRQTTVVRIQSGGGAIDTEHQRRCLEAWIIKTTSPIQS